MRKTTIVVCCALIIVVVFLIWSYIDRNGINNLSEVQELIEKQDEGTVNKPILLDGMRPISFEHGKEKPIILSKEEEKEGIWYNYEEQKSTTEDGGTSKWANAMTLDGSQWVWIPRFAYRIDWDGKEQSGNIDIVFLNGNTNYNMNGEDVTALGYRVHPAFKNGTKNGFPNGEWDKEITGFWVAKFEAGYAGQKNTASENVEIKNTNLKYNGFGINVLGEITQQTYMTYPVFMGKTYSYNNIEVGEIYDLSFVLTQPGNPYGFSENADSHMMKNSEWGAVTYLAHSKYGRNGTKVTINNLNIAKLSSPAKTVTGYAGKEIDESENILEDDELFKEKYNDSSYIWYTKEGTLGSTTGNQYGIYDMNGACSEYMAGYIASIDRQVSEEYAKNMLKIEKSSKYCTVFKSDDTINDYIANKDIYGDATIETSTKGSGYSAWFKESSIYINSNAGFFLRSGEVDRGKYSGLFNYTNHSGHAFESYGFRCVLIKK